MRARPPSPPPLSSSTPRKRTHEIPQRSTCACQSVAMALCAPILARDVLHRPSTEESWPASRLTRRHCADAPMSMQAALMHPLHAPSAPHRPLWRRRPPPPTPSTDLPARGGPACSPEGLVARACGAHAPARGGVRTAVPSPTVKPSQQEPAPPHCCPGGKTAPATRSPGRPLTSWHSQSGPRSTRRIPRAAGWRPPRWPSP